MDNQKPSEQIQIDQETETALKKRLLEQYSPPDMDNTMLRMIENEWALLTDELFFDLLRETPSWLRMEFFIKKIAEWQYIAGNDVFDAEMRKKAKENINEIPVGTSITSTRAKARKAPRNTFRGALQKIH